MLRRQAHARADPQALPRERADRLLDRDRGGGGGAGPLGRATLRRGLPLRPRQDEPDHLGRLAAVEAGAPAPLGRRLVWPRQRGLLALVDGLAAHGAVGGAAVAEAAVEARAVEDVAAGARSLDQASARGLERLEADGALLLAAR